MPPLASSAVALVLKQDEKEPGKDEDKVTGVEKRTKTRTRPRKGARIESLCDPRKRHCVYARDNAHDAWRLLPPAGVQRCRRRSFGKACGGEC